MDAHALDDFSRTVAQRLFEQFPEWRPFARVEHAADGRGYLSVTVPAPAGSAAAQGLNVTTSSGEVTVGFDYYHGHFPDHVGDGERFGVDYALYFVSELLHERIPVASWWTGGDLVAFSTIENGKPLLDEDLVGSYDHMRIRSWRGTLNADNHV